MMRYEKRNVLRYAGLGGIVILGSLCVYQCSDDIGESVIYIFSPGEGRAYEDRERMLERRKAFEEKIEEKSIVRENLNN
jgi:hypothetical protein